VNRAALAALFGLEPAPDAPLFGIVSRLTRQKGIDLLLSVLPRLLARGATLAVLGAGDRDLEQAFRAAATAYPRQVGVRIGYDEPLAHLLQAGADSIVVPSRFEPCGLTQLYALRYGSPPVVARTGGLADTVIDANDAAVQIGCATGFQFAPVAAGTLADALDRACDAFADRAGWSALVRRAMKHPVGWGGSAARYADLYARLAGRDSGDIADGGP
jgi:starch synthase